MMDSMFSNTQHRKGLQTVSGWLVDLSDGLYLLERDGDIDGSPKIKINNSQIMLAIIRKIPILGGGLYSLYYRATIIGEFTNELPSVIDAKRIFIDAGSSNGQMEEVDISPHLIEMYANESGNYIFKSKDAFSNDWLNDI